MLKNNYDLTPDQQLAEAEKAVSEASWNKPTVDNTPQKNPAPTAPVFPPAYGASGMGVVNEFGKVVEPTIEPPKVEKTGSEKTMETIASTFNASQAKLDETYNNWKTDLNNINNGIFALTPQEQGILDSIQTSLESAKNAQTIANTQYTSGIKQAGIRSGRQRYAPEIEAGNIQAAISAGVSKIQELENAALKEKYTIEQDLKDKRYDRLNTSYTNMMSYLKDKQQSMLDLQTAVLDYQQKQEEEKNQAIRDNLSAEKDLILKGYSPVTEGMDTTGLKTVTFNGKTYVQDATQEEATANAKDYMLAVKTGYTGSYMDFLNDQKGDSYETITDPSTGTLRIFNKKTGEFTDSINKTSTDGKTIVFGNDSYNLSTYATDPNQVNAINGYLTKIGKFNNAQDIDDYIKTNISNSPITSTEIISAASKYGVSWEVLTALMQHESLLGTSNVAKSNNNPGGIMYTGSEIQQALGIKKGTARPAAEGGNYAKFDTMQDGVDEVARQLSARKGKAEDVKTGAELSDIAKAVKNGITKLKDLPQAQRTAIASELQRYNEAHPQEITDEENKKIADIDKLIADTTGLKLSAGAYRGFEPVTLLSGNWGKAQNFIAGVNSIVSGLSLDALIDAKAQGATFGALSDSEMRILASSATKFGNWEIKDKDGKVIGFNAREEDVIDELKKIRDMLSKNKTGSTKSEGKTSESDPLGIL